MQCLNTSQGEPNKFYSLQLIKNTIAKQFKATLTSYEDAKSCIDVLEQQFKVSAKSIGASLWSRLANLRYDGSKGVREHIVEIVNLAEKLKEAKMTMSNELLSQIILNSLPSSFDPS